MGRKTVRQVGFVGRKTDARTVAWIDRLIYRQTIRKTNSRLKKQSVKLIEKPTDGYTDRSTNQQTCRLAAQ